MSDSTLDHNPLLKFEFRIPFDQIRAEDVKPAVERLLQQSEEEMERVIAAPGQRTFQNTIAALDSMTEHLDYAMGVVRHLEAVATTAELRQAYNEVQPAVTAFHSSIPLNGKLWKAIQDYARTDEAKQLSGVRKRFLQKTIDRFRRHGADLAQEGKKRLAEIDVELTKVTTQFSQNVLDSTNAFELIVTDEQRLAGLPAGAIQAARASAEAKGLAAPSWRFTLQAPSYIAVMTYLEDRELRRQMYMAQVQRATEPERDNRPLVRKILELRRERSTLLGYADFAALVLEERMAAKGERAQEFVEDLREKTEPFFVRENQALAEFAGNLDIQAWDLSFWAEKQRQALYAFDEEQLRPYFAMERVISGMFDVVQRLYGIEVTEKTGVPVWDPQVKYYEIRDSKVGEGLLGAFYADWYPRENKRDGAWMDAFITGLHHEDKFTPHAGLICGNLTPPVGDKPSLLTHREVETIFHEFGHLLHQCLSRVELRSFSGTNVAWDFVELPSQIMENWTWEREALDLFARDYQTGEVIPERLFEQMTKARTFRMANDHMRQLGFAYTDLALHREWTPDQDPVAFARERLQRFSPAPLPKEHAMVAAFTHLFAGPVAYAAGYYSYKWSQVLDADAFSAFKDKGVFDREVGERFRSLILAQGDSEDPAVLYRSFMGRDPNPEALLARSGFLAPV